MESERGVIGFNEKGNAHRKVRFILINSVRVLLLLAIMFAFLNERQLILVASVLLFIATFIPAGIKLFLKRDYFSSLDFIILIFIYGVFSYWEMKGAYFNFIWLAFLLKLIAALAVGFLGLTVIYSFFKHAKLEGNFKMIAIFGFCISFTIGVGLELVETFIDSFWGFHIQEVGRFGLGGDIAIYFLGCAFVSFIGYFNLKKGKILFVSTLIEEFIEKHLNLFGINREVENPVEHVKNLVKKNESHSLEFKSSLRKNLHTNALDRKIEHAILKTISAYLNSEGGTLLVGVSDKGEILGIKEDQFQSKDHADRHLNNLIMNHIGADFMPFINYEILDIDGKEVLMINCKPSSKEVFVKYDGDEQFFVRRGQHSVPLIGSSLLNYIETKFRVKT